MKYCVVNHFLIVVNYFTFVDYIFHLALNHFLWAYNHFLVTLYALLLKCSKTRPVKTSLKAFFRSLCPISLAASSGEFSLLLIFVLTA